MSTLGYGSMAILGYLMYGEQLKSQVTLNLPIQELSSQIAIYTTLISPLTKYALIINPISTAIEEKLHTENRLVSIIVRTTLVVSTVIVALVIPLFGYVMAFIGSFLIVTLSIVLPCLCYVKLNGLRNNKLEMGIVWAILGLGVAVGTIGTYNSVRNIIKNI